MILQSFRIFHTITLAVVAIAASVGVLSAQRPASALTGRVTSEKEGSMEGVVVTARKDSDRWDGVPANGKMSGTAGIASLLLWVGVIAASRWIAFA